MKKLLCIVPLVLIMLFSSACGGSESPAESTGETETRPVFTTGNQTFSREYRDSDNRKVSKLSVTLPKLDESYGKECSETVNGFFGKLAGEYDRQIEKNIENTSDYLEKLNLKGPEVTEISYEIYNLDSTFFSVTVLKKTAVDIEKAEPSAECYTFSMKDGHTVSLHEYMLTAESADFDSSLADAAVAEANRSYSDNAVDVSENQAQMLRELCSSENFLADESGIAYALSRGTLSGGSRTGIYMCEISYDELSEVMADPYNIAES